MKKISDRPEFGKQYALTGGLNTPSIMNGNTWAESEVKKDNPDVPAEIFEIEESQEMVELYHEIKED